MLDFDLLLDLRFSSFPPSNFLLHSWYDVLHVYLIDNAIEVAYSETDVSLLLSVIGILNMVREFVGDKPWANLAMLYAACMGGCGLVVALIPFFTSQSYKLLSVVSGGFGLLIAANYSLISIILEELISIERFTNCLRPSLLLQGIANLVGPPLAGWLYDVPGSYDLLF